jgi:uncharacterized protein (DUF2267 family)
LQYGEFVSNVRTLAELESNDQAENAIRATLETLRERLAGNEPNNLAAQLPPELAGYVQGEGGRERFSLGEFYDRVARKEGVGPNEATVHARAVASVLMNAVTEGEIDDIRDQLGEEYADLFGKAGA